MYSCSILLSKTSLLKTTNACIFSTVNRKKKFLSATSRSTKFGFSRKPQTLYMTPMKVAVSTFFRKRSKYLNIITKTQYACTFTFLILNYVKRGYSYFLFAILTYVQCALKKKQLIAFFVEQFKRN